MTTNNRPETRLATRLAFVAAGFAMACWAPLVPFAKENVGVDDAGLGLLLLCLGVGSIMAMPVTGWLAAQIGSKPLIMGGGIGLVLLLPLLTLTSSALGLAVVLMLFGASLGTLDVAMNIHAVEVERDSARPLMSGFHAMFSIGGFAGAAGVTVLLSLGLSPVQATICGSLLTWGALLLAWPRLLAAKGGQPMPFALPKGIVLLLSVLAGITFLVEGAILDWGALLVVGKGLLDHAHGGVGYMLFAAAMTLGRLTGDRVVGRFGGRQVLIVGGAVGVLGIVILLVSPHPVTALLGFVLIGLGASNIVPVLFSLAGRQRAMSPAMAVAAVTTVGYAGILIGPAALGLISHHLSLPIAFGLLAVLLAVIPASAHLTTRQA
ncbi:MFS transporter [Paracoccus litorisediminis]|uniref:MFS transporter n=1 Tax=Paracoccus litorisediminis TaxID=2006130 RepID=A0A844HRM4_9RHOB|nr:MFS transporter [Paracoccus litorisediminis]MTH60835.1 MFS transporter [Paracoccus litorisediminis]